MVKCTASPHLLSCKFWSPILYPAGTPSLVSHGHQTTLEWPLGHNRSPNCTRTHMPCNHITHTCTIHLHISVFFVVCVQATIHIADPLQLSACSLVSTHGCSPIVGLDIVSPGSGHIVVCGKTQHVVKMLQSDCILFNHYLA